MTTTENPQQSKQAADNDTFRQYGQPVNEVLFPNDSAIVSAPNRPAFDPEAAIHQSTLKGDDLTDAVKAAGCNPHAVDKAVARQHTDATTLGYDGQIVQLRRGGPNCS